MKVRLFVNLYQEIFVKPILSYFQTLIEGSKTFGVVHQRYRSSAPGLTEESNIGTTAEIYEFREPSPESLEVGLKIKCKGRQRFRILSMRRQIDGTKVLFFKNHIHSCKLLTYSFFPSDCHSRISQRNQTHRSFQRCQITFARSFETIPIR